MIKHSDSAAMGNQEDEGGGNPPPKSDAATGASSLGPNNNRETGNSVEGSVESTENGYFNKEAYHPQQTIGGGGVYKTSTGTTLEIRDVWAENLETEMHVIRQMAEKYEYIAMDTEFPGVVARPIADYNSPDYQYQTLRCNVDLLKIIQLGLAFVNSEGELIEGCCCWQFNFKFNLKEDMYAQESIDLLRASGISFAVHEQRGIDVQYFGELLITSGLVLLDNICWISFHSGYDFGYLLKILTAQALPAEENRFFEILKIYFPNIFDVKYLVASVDGVHGGLQRLAEELKVERIGPMHQAGSDSLLTASTFFAIIDSKFGGISNLDREKYIGELYGLGGNNTVYKPKAARVELIPDQSMNAGANGTSHLSSAQLGESESENFNSKQNNS